MRSSRIIAGTVAAAVAVLAGWACSGILPSEPLTPARSLAGTWTTPAAVPMNYQTDLCSGTRETVAKATWLATWIITAQAGTTDGIDVEMHMQQSASTKVASSCGNSASGYVPEPSPIFMTGVISASRITLYSETGPAFDGNLTTDNIAGTFGAWECIIYCSGEKSDPEKFILTKNH